MANQRNLSESEQDVLKAFFALLDDDDLARLDRDLQPNITNAPNWWFRDQVSEAMAKKKADESSEDTNEAAFRVVREATGEAK